MRSIDPVGIEGAELKNNNFVLKAFYACFLGIAAMTTLFNNYYFICIMGGVVQKPEMACN